jgi:hypothetical protein
MLDDAAARTDLDVLFFFFSKRNHTSSTWGLQQCVSLIVTPRYWSGGKKQNLLSFLASLCKVHNGRWECWIVCSMRLDINKHPHMWNKFWKYW